jgi:hypothetical protein
MRREYEMVVLSDPTALGGVNAKPRAHPALLKGRMPPVPLIRKRIGPYSRSGHFGKQQNTLHLPGIELQIFRCPVHITVIIPTANLFTTVPTLIGPWLIPAPTAVMPVNNQVIHGTALNAVPLTSHY